MHVNFDIFIKNKHIIEYMMVLVTGNKGYIGSVLSKILLDKGHSLVGLDTDFYRGCSFFDTGNDFRQITKDIRDVLNEDFEGIDAVIHLAALSNDPLGEFNVRLTEDINYKGTLHVARMAKASGVKRFVYASSQSMYGVSNSDDELDEDASEKNPVTAYARTKWDAELRLKQMVDDDFVVVCMRPSTVFGASHNFRADIVFNNFVASAYTTGKIKVKSDGIPWRPVVHVRDASRAFIAGLEAPQEIVRGESFNIGILDGNYTVRQLAEAAQRSVLGSQLVFTGEHGKDSRTYKVSFKKILTKLKDYYKPEWDLDMGGKELVGFFKDVGFSEEHYTGRRCNRLQQIKFLLENKNINDDLKWIK